MQKNPPLFTRPAMIGENNVIVTLAGRRVRLPHHRASGLARTPGIDLVVDLNRERVSIGGRELVLEASLIPLNILAALARAGGELLSIPDLFALAWGRPYNRRHHHNTFHSQMSRLRRMLRDAAPDRSLIITEGATYRLAAGLRACLIDPVAPPAWCARRPETLIALARARGFIDRRIVRATTGLSESRAHEVLQGLARSGALVREGSGRGARYRVSGSATPPSSSKITRRSSPTLQACEMQPAGR